MRILVQKFGGTSVAGLDRLKRVQAKVAAALNNGYRVLVVLSAMAGETNQLLELSEKWSESPDSAELDALLVTGEQRSICLFTPLLRTTATDRRGF